jgi:histidyl-tRNA synthetase
LLGKGFDPEALARLAPLFELEGTADEKLNTLASLLETSEVGQEGIAEIQFILTQLKSNPLAAAVDLNVTLARGLDYYTGLIVEVAAPEGVKMGSIGGGGRYDDLTSSFGLKDKSGIGISFGFDRIGLVLEELDLYPNTVHSPTQLLVSQFEPAANPWSLQLIHQLREAGMAAEFYPTTAKFKKQLSYANQKQIPWVVICAIQEFEQREFVLKNMTTGEESRHSMDVAFSVIQNELLG